MFLIYLFRWVYYVDSIILPRNIFTLSTVNYNALHFCLAIKIHAVKGLLLNDSTLSIVNENSQNVLIKRPITAKRTCKPCVITIKINFYGTWAFD